MLSLIHISEPTRRTPISYAVFCLKKKRKKQDNKKTVFYIQQTIHSYDSIFHLGLCQKQVYLVTLVPKKGIPGHIDAKNGYILKPSTNLTPGALRLASVTSHRTCFWLEKARYTWFCLLCLLIDFNRFWRFLSQSHTLAPRHVSYDV